MNAALWVLVGWLFGCGMFLLGCWWASTRTDRWRARALVAEANTDHALCQVTETTMANFIAYQERELDAYWAGNDLGDEAEEYLRDGGQ